MKCALDRSSKIKMLVYSMLGIVLVGAFQNCSQSGGMDAAQVVSNSSSNSASDSEDSAETKIKISLNKSAFAVGEAISGKVTISTKVSFTGDILFLAEVEGATPFSLTISDVNFVAGQPAVYTFKEINNGVDPVINKIGDYKWKATVLAKEKIYTSTEVLHITEFGSSSTDSVSASITSQSLSSALTSSLELVAGPYVVNGLVTGKVCVNAAAALPRAYVQGALTGPACKIGDLPIYVRTSAKVNVVSVPAGKSCYNVADLFDTALIPPCAGTYGLVISLTEDSGVHGTSVKASLNVKR